MFTRLSAGLIAVALTLAACGSSAATGARTVTRTLQASVTPSPQPNGYPSCAPKDLGIHFEMAQGAAGHIISIFDFVNVTSRPCRLQGYPGASAFTRSGARIKLDVARNTAFRPRRVILRPGQRAPFTFETTDQAAGGPCQTSRILRFIPPGDFAYEQIAHRQLICRRLSSAAAEAVVGPVGVR